MLVLVALVADRVVQFGGERLEVFPVDLFGGHMVMSEVVVLQVVDEVLQDLVLALAAELLEVVALAVEHHIASLEKPTLAVVIHLGEEIEGREHEHEQAGREEVSERIDLEVGVVGSQKVA